MTWRETTEKWSARLDRVLSAVGIQSGYPEMRDAETGLLAPEVPIPSDKPKIVEVQKRDGATDVYGVPATLITSGFLVPTGEFNPALMGREGVTVWEKMRRTDAQVDKTLEMCAQPILAAKWQIVAPPKEELKKSSKVSNTGAGKATAAKAEEIADAAKENLFGGLEWQDARGSWHTQTWNEVLRNALLMLAMGCAAHERVYRVDGQQLRLSRLPDLPPKSFYRWDVEPDGRTLSALIQLGFRGNLYNQVSVPADRLTMFVYRQEGADFWGRPMLRAAYSHWYAKNLLYRIRAIAAEKNGAGIPCVTLPANASAEDRASAIAYVTSIAVHEKTGLVLPNGATFKLHGVEGQVFDSMQDVIHHNEQISFTALDFFSNLGRSGRGGAGGSRALGQSQGKFFSLALQNTADFIAQQITQSDLRDWAEINYGPDAPVPVLKAANVQSRGFEETMALLTQAAAAGLVVSDRPARDYVREESGLPEETGEDVVAIKGETVTEGPAGASGDISGRSAAAIQDLQTAHAKMPDGAPGKDHVESALGKLKSGQKPPAGQTGNPKPAPQALSDRAHVPTLYALRHVHTAFNSTTGDPQDARLRGLRDVLPDRQGLREIQEIGKQFEGIKLALILTSPLKRARMLADALHAATGAPIEETPLLLPRGYGILTGKKIRDVAPELSRLQRDWNRAPQGGDTLRQAWERSKQGIETALAAAEDSDAPVAIVTHSSVIAWVPAALSGSDPRGVNLESRISPGSVLKIEKHSHNWKIAGEEPAADAEKLLSEAILTDRATRVAPRRQMSQFWREGDPEHLKHVYPSEAHLDAPAIFRGVNDAQARIERLLKSKRRKVQRAMARKMAVGLKQGKKPAEVELPGAPEIEPGINLVLRNLYRSSALEVHKERERLGKPRITGLPMSATAPIHLATDGQPAGNDRPGLIAEISAQDYTERLANAARNTANDLRRQAPFDPESDLAKMLAPEGAFDPSSPLGQEAVQELADELVAAMEEYSDGFITPIAAGAARDTMRAGRSAEWQAIVNELEKQGVKVKLVRVSVLEPSSCGPCVAANGQEISPGEDITAIHEGPPETCECFTAEST